ncbi:MAG: GNAT family N-acetyltransferase [Cocleimonas sp.]
MKIIQAQTEHLDTVRTLFQEYQSDVNQGGNCECFEGFEDELASLPGNYSKPKGIIYLAFASEDYSKSTNAIGCIAIRPRDGKPKEAEIKRLYVRANKRGSGAGQHLLNNVFMFAKMNKYSALFLETTATMQAAKSLYDSYGFEQAKSNNSNIECYQYAFKQDEKKK